MQCYNFETEFFPVVTGQWSWHPEPSIPPRLSITLLTVSLMRPLSFDGFGKVVGIVVARRNAMYLLMSNDYRVYYADVANAKMSFKPSAFSSICLMNRVIQTELC